MMAYFIDAKGKKLVVDSTHEEYAKHQLKSDLKSVLKSYVRVTVYKDQFCFETSQKVLSVKQKHMIILVYREHHCRGYTSRIGDKMYESDRYETVKRINFHKCTGRY